MTEIEELIEAARAVLKKWRPPRKDEAEKPQTKSWQEILDNRGYDAGQVSYMAGQSKGL